MCKILTVESHAQVAAGEEMSLDTLKSGSETTEKGCLTPCATSDGCLEATWDKANKRCYLSNKAHLHPAKSEDGGFRVLQCISLTDEEVAAAEPIAPKPQVNATSTNATKLEIAPQTPAQAKLAEEKAAEEAQALKAKADSEAQELANEKAEKEKAAKQVEAASAQAKAAAEALKLAHNEKQKELAEKQAADAAKEKQKADEEQARLVAEGKVKKEKSEKANALQKLAEAKKERTDKAAKFSEMAMEKREKNDRWYRKGHLLFAQGIKYQSLLEKLSKSHNKLDAYHYQEELGTYSKAFPEGFTAPLSAKEMNVLAEQASNRTSNGEEPRLLAEVEELIEITSGRTIIHAVEDFLDY